MSSSCQLNFSSFYQLKIPKTQFINCKLEEVDFTESQLQEVIFDGSNLKNAIFEATNLEKSDFTSALHFSIDPDANRLKGAKFSKDNLIGLLHKYKISIE